ncbi:response regulator transcription factor [Clostridium formicaceticum]|uniref:Stage 0 sporulation protein A homolog n=1 Tax=Clostridium formicaceticum TaxID=1497 RepID=A0AAC9RKV9_9CLOT|nr:response regulator [Clostridium formicaceticum]AOY77034.1 hypothetical protein BJL90_14955 [Clostridium formicaceticum]ARE87534.1 putative response regulatory protein [Clostridium formicaceticum]
MLKVLIADDEPKIRKGIKLWIGENTYPFEVVGEAKNGREALEFTTKTSPELFLVDINMPMVNGLDFISQLKKLCPNSIVVIITGYDHFEYAHRAIKLQVFDYLLKPVSKSDFNHLLKRITEEFQPNEKEHIEDKNIQYSCIVRCVKGHIDHHYAESQLDLSYIAKLFNVNKSYISKRMKQELGRSFVEYLTEVRLEKAKEILESADPRVTMYHVATKVGYTSQHYFSRVFKKAYGIAPLEYRNSFHSFQ